MRATLCVLAAACGLTSWAVVAQANQQLTADQAVKLALESSPALAASGHRIREARARVDVALRIDNPQLRLGPFRSDRLLMPAIENRAYTDPYEDMGFRLRWRPPNLGAWDARRARAERRVDQRSAELRQDERELTAKVRSLHARVINLQARIDLAETAVELRGKMRKLTQQRLEQQIATALDRNFAELDYLDAIADREELRREQQERLHALLVAIGLPAEHDVDLVADSQDHCMAPTQPVATLIERAESINPELQVHQARIAEVEADIARSRLERIPWFDYIQASYILGEGADPFTLSDQPCSRAERSLRTCDNPAYLSVRFAINLPVFDWNQAEIAGLEARKAAFEATRQAARQRIARRVRRTFDALGGTAQLYAQYRVSDRDFVVRSIEQIHKAIEAGEADMVQMATVQRRTLRTRRARLRSLLRCQLSTIELWRLAGDAPRAAPVDSSAHTHRHAQRIGPGSRITRERPGVSPSRR